MAKYSSEQQAYMRAQREWQQHWSDSIKQDLLMNAENNLLAWAERIALTKGNGNMQQMFRDWQSADQVQRKFLVKFALDGIQYFR